jgi:hypothetical protein
LTDFAGFGSDSDYYGVLVRVGKTDGTLAPRLVVPYT